jgi:hypothetical protein
MGTIPSNSDGKNSGGRGQRAFVNQATKITDAYALAKHCVLYNMRFTSY